MPAAVTVDPIEVERFSRMAAEWWDPKGKFKPLHKFNPVRLAVLKREIALHFSRDARAARSLDGLRILDVGCGGGLVSEPLARLCATVVGIDPSATNVEVARLHAVETGLAVDYRATTAEALAAAGERFDVVLALEVVEHVADVPAFLDTVSSMAKPGGLVVVATINRTLKALGLAIVGAEYVLRWLPRGTHSYDKLVRPEEVEAPLQDAGLVLLDRVGVVFDPLRDVWKESRDTAVNYMVIAARPA
ncbi:bifunctional 2-polyprenyl-6-hydroxyphenol methylase/3-demethylubiquinol 3-O-methyltransferase UbiG [Oharaeibacter diazotrophicus]|uniref:Ubiquinone biosynthesis O-methyltransferase n=1 Tax=Oharaeibacter diazotrophicus TaxID=1920512 RepID=A0A4R6R5R5_9HYPH|nr:bifunctional 2-polyprenyl-6-hydroxyphenol methylase/3-demethylubiquinol 3-O-methyltransferase UbiG [Oharaeibacter diazotrophicus]TDP80945.1 3-demethylubiquinone-9 3-methyltransferase [Oharaeibacter diazotrophicus]BBE73839.1 ubiquinone biosynthesis O-methyltransferase [Pleomorphomonas sp. SM30]GLS74676.1 ubiquinone biosynthesis O-methyltransferase [Oharaeibacter diazotrophicus]